jgi:hypothetical protein
VGDAVDLVVEAVCRLPIDYRQFGTYSIVDLIRRAGFERARVQVTDERIHACLADHPDWVDEWVRFSEDTRGSPAWYVEKARDGRWEVGFYDGGRQNVTLFDDRISACVEYILATMNMVVDRPRRPLPE